ncbi:MAG: alpha-L-fucosidase [Chitinophagaceae bacterium]|nr:alpha-L-fucosidase [Chitinophagaceae bacterium]
MKFVKAFLPMLACCTGLLYAQPRPTATQQAWHQQEFYLFMHFGPNTFTGKEWGHGDEKTEVFNPTALDTEQWCRVAKAAGATGIIITAKHHDGFCLWPSAYSTHTVRESKWRNGKGDVLKELSASCRKWGLKFGVYLSPWDRNHPSYGTPAYNDVYANTLKEIFANYGPIWELWWDGANGEGPNGKRQVYDFPRFEKLVRQLSPNTVIFSDIGPDTRWVGNESGIAGTTNWNTLDTAGFQRGQGGPPTDTLNSGNRYGRHWIPAECDVSIRPGWFYHAEEDGKVKSGETLFQLYLKSVGRGANLLLNVPPDTRGLIHENDSAALVGFAQLRQQLDGKRQLAATATLLQHNIKKQVTALLDQDLKTGVQIALPAVSSVALDFAKPTTLNCMLLAEDLRQGQAVAAFTLKLYDDKGELLRSVAGTTIGQKRLLTFAATTASRVVLEITDTNKLPVQLASMQAYLLPAQLVEK